MSDEEDYEYEYDDDGDEQMEDNFEYTDDEDDNNEETNDVEVALENAYYNAKGLRDTSVEEAVESFEEVIKLESEELSKNNSGDDGGDDSSSTPTIYGPWSFKAIKQLVKLYLRSNNYAEMMKHYQRLLQCISSGSNISPNAIEKGINGMLDRVSQLMQVGSGSTTTDTSSINNPQVLARNVYDSTLKIFHPKHGTSPNERLWFKTNLKYGQLLYEMNETNQLQLVLKDLKSHQQEQQDNAMNTSSATDDGIGGGASSSSSSSSTHLMEIYALQIQLYSRLKDHKKLRTVFTKAMSVRGGIPHPRTLALIQELGGKMHMSAKEYESAGKTFFQAFKSYDEAGDPSRLKCLKYLVMASMLHASTINPFDSQEARPYRDDPEIVQMTNLVQSFHNNDISQFESILSKKNSHTGKHLMDDEFVREHVEDLLRTIRTQVLKKIIRPYTRISLTAIANELNNIPMKDVESLLVSLILDGSLEGQIDQVTGVLLKKADKYDSIEANTQQGSSAGGGTSAGAGSATGANAASGASGGGASSTIGMGNSLELQKCNALEQLSLALETLSTNITSTPSINSKGGGFGGKGGGIGGGPGGLMMVH